MITQRQINNADFGQLLMYRDQLVVAKMKIDKFFSIFLDQYELPEDDTCTSEWFTYNEMLKQYGLIDSLKRAVDYRIEHV